MGMSCSDRSMCIDEYDLKLIQEALESARITYEVMTENPPWSDNAIMVGCVKGCWMGTPEKISKSLDTIKQLFKAHGL